VEVDPARSERSVGTASGLDRGRDLGLGHPELRAAGADGQARQGLGRHVRVEPVENVEPAALPSDATGQVSEVGRLLG
jgi:hypothetical protein